ncbi:TMEM175 family protein [Flavobacterium sp. ZS1P70]|uniref:TMEM175 family protein n=1 Tax=Flavobacterium zhoui TaxID=3230414 RepID=A0ABW6I9W7_9FLAO
MDKHRLEMFSDGVLAIIITIMILEIKVPMGNNFSDLTALFPSFISYALSFIFVGIYWKNHYHLMQSISKINGTILWANLHFLFWLSLIPISTKWMGVHLFAKATMTLYGIILFLCSLHFWILQCVIITNEGTDSLLAKAVGKDRKGKVTLILYFIAILFSFLNEWIAGSIYVMVAMIWLKRDKKIERKINSHEIGPHE